MTDQLIRALFAVESQVVRLEEMARVLGRDADSGHDIGSRSELRPGHVRDWALWELRLVPDESLHVGTEGLSLAIEQLGEDLADRAARLATLGCDVVLSIVQKLDVSDSRERGLHFSAGALAWLARARAEVDIDQYVIGFPVD